MTVRYHPDFANDIHKFAGKYRQISEGLAVRFRKQVEETIDAIKHSPEGAGHFLYTGSEAVREFRRRNLRAFPFFVLYGVTGESLLFGALIPSRSDPITWLTRFGQGR